MEFFVLICVSSFLLTFVLLCYWPESQWYDTEVASWGKRKYFSIKNY